VLILSEKTVITNLEGLENFILLNNLSKTDADSVISNVDVLAITRPDNKVVRFSFASKILTYIALGKPIFSSAVGDINFHVLNYINGMTYQPGNENDMKDKMNALRDCDLRKRIFENNLIYAKKTLTWEKQIKELFVFLNSDK
jgi:glycosyltransferase involved in cell wall biosynthesis